MQIDTDLPRAVREILDAPLDRLLDAVDVVLAVRRGQEAVAGFLGVVHAVVDQVVGEMMLPHAAIRQGGVKDAIDKELAKQPEVGEYNQKI